MDFNWTKDINRKLEVGDRIKLIHMDDVNSIEPGTVGTVKSIQYPVGIISVDWDGSNRLLNMVFDKVPGDLDTFEILDESTLKEEINTDALQSEIELGLEIELENYPDPIEAKEVVMSNLEIDSDYYSNTEEAQQIHENFFGSLNPFKKKENKDDQYDTEKMVKHLKKITDSIKTSGVRNEESIVKMIENFREKYKEHSKIDTMIKSLYFELREKGEGIDELTSAGASSGSFTGPLGGNSTIHRNFYNENKVIKVSDLMSEMTSTKNSGKITDAQSESPFDSNKDGWFWNDKPMYDGGEVVDHTAQLDTNWKDEILSVTKEDLIRSVKLVEGHEDVTTQICTNCWDSGVEEDGSTCPVCGGEGHVIVDKKDIEETTTFGSVFGGDFPVTPFGAKKGQHKPGKKPIWKGGKIVQKIKNSGVLSEINKTKYNPDAEYVKFNPKCTKYNNKPWCNQGAVDKPITLSKTTTENISEVAKKLGITEDEVKKVVINKLTK